LATDNRRYSIPAQQRVVAALSFFILLFFYMCLL
jgi:hypothetical protein